MCYEVIKAEFGIRRVGISKSKQSNSFESFVFYWRDMHFDFMLTVTRILPGKLKNDVREKS